MTGMHPLTVFIVDDDAAHRDSVRELVHSAGLRAATFPSVSAFLSARDACGVGCLVLDVRTARRSEPSIGRWLRTLCLPVLLVMDVDDLTPRQNLLRTEGAVILRKPYRAQALLDAIERVLCGSPEPSRDALRPRAAAPSHLPTVAHRHAAHADNAS
ncbi:hypothetical protein QTH97_28120 [Variovorax sp. J22R24]|uniref:response regulator n=1 Tax=Variovorax gracilis TaxID=3053502 RepID=UPI00257790FE|nr:response regulator [Variovorax sp. J22R24]MDM0108839.1 hypothetical protein [Variovorax sp. J22R24]